jgi:hypothetical protein
MRLASLLLLAACAADPPASPPPAATGPRAVAPRGAPSITEVRVRPVATQRAEDGRGNVIEAPRPIAIELRAPGGWPGRALDPVLHVGELLFREYTFPEPEVIRFVAADEALVPAGAAMAVQYGDDLASRVEVRR